MTEPTFDFSPPPNPPPKIGWFAITIVLLALIGLQLVGYFGRQTPDEIDYAEIDGRVKLAFRSYDLMQTLPATSEQKEDASRTYSSALQEIVRELEAKKLEDGGAALIHTVLRHELGEESDPKVLATLSRDEGPRRRAAAKLYAAPKLTKEEADELTRPFTGEVFFLDKMVNAHAAEKAGGKDASQILSNPGANAAMLGVVFALVGFALLGGGLLFTYLISRGLGRAAPIGHPSGSLTATESDANALRTSLLLPALFGGQIVVAVLAGGLRLPDVSMSLLAFLVAIGAAVFIVRSRIHGARRTLESIGLHTRDLGKNVLWGIGGAIANIPLIIVTALIGLRVFDFLPDPEHPVQMEMLTNRTPLGMALIFATAAICAPIFEEITFRGVFLPALIERFRKPGWGIVACGFLFAAIHPTGIPAWLPLMMIGVMASFLTYQRASLVPAIVMHAVHNGAIVLISFAMFS